MASDHVSVTTINYIQAGPALSAACVGVMIDIVGVFVHAVRADAPNLWEVA
jgi:hypothetical protein